MEISAQVSLYPLGQSNLAPAIEAVWWALRDHGLSPQPGAMSTLVQGDDGTVFAALHDAFANATQFGGAVMVVTVSNVCPALPERSAAEDASTAGAGKRQTARSGEKARRECERMGGTV